MLKLICLLIFLTHGDLEERIAQVTRQIEQDPDDAALYVERSRLYFQHEDYTLSKRDLQTAERLSDDIPALDYLMAKTAHALGQLDSALFFVNEYLRNPMHIQHTDAVSLKGEILFSKADYWEAAKCYEWSTSLYTRPSPDLFVKAAEAYLKSQDSDNMTRAISVLKAGKQRLGHLYVFDKTLMEIYIDHQDYDSAINILTEIIDRSRRKARFYVQRANLYRLNSNITLAMKDLDLAIAEIQSLPPFIRNNKASAQLVVQIDQMKNEWK